MELMEQKVSAQPFPRAIGSHSEVISPLILLYHLHHQPWSEVSKTPKSQKNDLEKVITDWNLVSMYLDFDSFNINLEFLCFDLHSFFQNKQETRFCLKIETAWEKL